MHSVALRLGSRVLAVSMWTGLSIGLAACSQTATAVSRPEGHRSAISANVAGRSYAAWEVAWWQWRASLPKRKAASSNACITAKQGPRVWFLGGNEYSGIKRSIRDCTIPSHDFVFIGAPSIDCSTIEPTPFFADTDTGLRACAHEKWSAEVPTSRVVIDRSVLVPSGVLVATPAFDFGTPATDSFLNVSGRTSGRAAVYGYATMLKPLKRGQHVIVAELKYGDLRADRVTYRVTSN